METIRTIFRSPAQEQNPFYPQVKYINVTQMHIKDVMAVDRHWPMPIAQHLVATSPSRY